MVNKKTDASACHFRKLVYKDIENIQKQDQDREPLLQRSP